MRELIARLPKAELHMHLEGSIEPDLMFRLAARNGVTLKWPDEAALQAAYDFRDLQSFLDVYYAGLTVLKTADDFRDMTVAYLEKVAAENVVHAEVFISPQAHTRRGVPFAAMMEGIEAGLAEGRTRFGMTCGLIAGLQRQWSEEDAFAMLEEAKPWRDRILGLGLGGPEVGNPPQKFARVFAAARDDYGWKTTAHAGEEGPAQYVADTVDVLKVDRVDHGVRAWDDRGLVRRLAEIGVPLTVCPVSNVKLRVFDTMAEHNLKKMLDAGVKVTVNSDDPSYFLGYMNENFIATQEALDLTRDDLRKLSVNAFEASFIDDATRTRYLQQVEACFAAA